MLMVSIARYEGISSIDVLVHELISIMNAIVRKGIFSFVMNFISISGELGYGFVLY
jgi:hypothetical protein